MTEQVPSQEEERLREEIRARLEQQSSRLAQELGSLRNRESRLLEAERVRRILEEERDVYYSKLGYVKIAAGDGTEEWMPPERAQAFDDKVGEEIDDIEGGQRKVRWFAIAWFGVFVFVVLLLVFFFWPKSGSIRVITNFPGAAVVLNNDTTAFRTDTVITDVVAGRHIVSVYKYGYRIEGDIYRQVELKHGEEALVAFQLAPAPIRLPSEAPVTAVTTQRDTILEKIHARVSQRIADTLRP